MLSDKAYSDSDTDISTKWYEANQTDFQLPYALEAKKGVPRAWLGGR